MLKVSHDGIYTSIINSRQNLILHRLYQIYNLQSDDVKYCFDTVEVMITASDDITFSCSGSHSE